MTGFNRDFFFSKFTRTLVGFSCISKDFHCFGDIFRSFHLHHVVITTLLNFALMDSVFQARQVLEREFNNLLALGTDRRLEEVTGQAVIFNQIKYGR